jgi:hypothetical protein
VHGSVAGFKDRVDFDGERLAAGAAFVDAYPRAFASELDAVIHNAAMRTHPPLLPNDGFYPLVSRLLIVEPRMI